MSRRHVQKFKMFRHEPGEPGRHPHKSLNQSPDLLDDIQSYLALAACVGTYIVSSKYRKIGTFIVGIRPSFCSPVES